MRHYNHHLGIAKNHGYDGKVFLLVRDKIESTDVLSSLDFMFHITLERLRNEGDIKNVTKQRLDFRV